MRNIFCRVADLDSEADVESLFVDRLLAKLRYPDNRILRKDSLDEIKIGQGRRKEPFRPDYVLLDRKRRPAIVLDAKAPSESVANYHYQVSGYALSLNQRYEQANPVKYVVVTNGLKLLVYLWDSERPRLQLDFQDFEEDNPRFVELRSLLSYGALDVLHATEDAFHFARPDLNELVRVFIDCHNLIWRKEKMGPTEAFYEFAKLMFVKLREDQRIAQMVEQGRQPSASDFNFSVAWIEEQVEKGIDDNPLGSILFRKIRDELEEKIRTGEKKRIFLRDETLNLRLSTVVEVVRMLEHYDLHGIDEDLNGRMFETFLNATVRGKELGQFFTPRSVVKYMSHTVALSASANRLPYVLDGCCGSGGFLIEAMARLVHDIDAMTSLSSTGRGRLKKTLFDEHLFGIDASETIARIGRLNMYLHGDGGSKIFTADTLDKELRPDKGLPPEKANELKELRGYILDEELRFDAILTNPPFSMSYKRTDPHEGRILEQYRIALTKDGRPSSSAKSNVLFLERYCDLLCDGGEILTVIDNTILNGYESQAYRDFILEHFVIRQVVALPFNTFFRAQANVQTSILHLRKKQEGEEQGYVFMAILNNVGHDDHQRYTPERDNTPELLPIARDWMERGEPVEIFKENEASDENLGCPFQAFLVAPKELNPARLDAFYYAPDLRLTRQNLLRRAEEGLIELIHGRDLHIVSTMTRQEEEEANGEVFRYFEIGDVTRAGAITGYREDLLETLPSRARLRVRHNDVLFAKNNSSRGTAVIVPPEFDGQLVTTGFIAVRPRDYEEALLLWSIFQSETFRKQIYYLAVTAVQPEVREDIFRDKFLLPVPKHKRDRDVLVDHARRVQELHEESRQKLRETGLIAEELFEGFGREPRQPPRRLIHD